VKLRSAALIWLHSSNKLVVEASGLLSPASGLKQGSYARLNALRAGRGLSKLTNRKEALRRDRAHRS